MRSELKRFQPQPFRPDENKFGIYLPQACRGLAHGPNHQIHYLTASVGPCVAVALTGLAKGERYPMIEYGHLDGVDGPKEKGAELVHYARQDFAGKFLPSKAYLITGMDFPQLYYPMLEKFKNAGFECFINVENTPSWLTIDLESGLPVLADMDNFHMYAPTAEATPQFIDYAVTMPRTPILLSAFDLTKAVPQTYQLYRLPSIAEAPRPT